MRYRDLVTEVHHSDLYPKAFAAFLTKYRPFAGRGDLYVNFTDHNGNTLDKSFSPKPNHGDPAGLYAYPLEYVVNHPANIQYGQQARFLRVIQDTSRNKLVLPTMTQEQALAILARMGIGEPQKKMAVAAKRVREGHLAGNLVAKAFFHVVQYYSAVGQKTRLGNREQSALFLKAGIDAVEDRSTNAREAIIYPDEPEQIVFLSRTAFRVADVYELRSARNASINKNDPAENLRRLPALLAQRMGDRLVKANTTGERSEEQTFYTAAKRKIVVKLDKVYDWQKGNHREISTASKEGVRVSILGNGFAPVIGQYPADMPFTDIAEDMGKRFEARQTKDGGADFSRESEHGPDVARTIATLAAVAAKLKVPYTPPTTDNQAYLIHRCIEQVGDWHRHPRAWGGGAKAMVAAATAIIDAFWEGQRTRAPQADTIIQVWTKAATKARLSANALFSLNGIAEALNVVADAPAAAPGAYRKTFGDLTIDRDGAAIVASVGGAAVKIGTLDSNKYTPELYLDRKLAKNNIDLAKHGESFATYFNDHDLHCDGYATSLASTLGIMYEHGTWKTLKDGARKVPLKNGCALWFVKGAVLADVRGEYNANEGRRDFSKDVGGDYPLLPPNMVPFHELRDILSIKGGKVAWVSDEALEASVDASKEEDGYRPYMDESALLSKAVSLALRNSGFNLVAFMKDEGLEFSNVQEKTLRKLNLKQNKDTGKIGEAITDIWDPVGKFNGVPVYSVYSTTDVKRRRLYLVRHDGKPKGLLATEPNHTDDGKAIKILAIADDLPKELRAVARELVDNLGLPVPRNLQSNLRFGGK